MEDSARDMGEMGGVQRARRRRETSVRAVGMTRRMRKSARRRASQERKKEGFLFFFFVGGWVRILTIFFSMGNASVRVVDARAGTRTGGLLLQERGVFAGGHGDRVTI